MDEKIIFKEIYNVKAVPPEEGSRSELTDLLIIGEGLEGQALVVRIRDYVKESSSFSKFQEYYNPSNIDI